MNYRQLYKLIILLCALALTACSTTQQAYIQNFQFYFAGQKDVELTEQEIVNSPIDLIYVKNGDRAYATMALAFIENGQYKWLSKDNVMFITQNGRLIQTLGLAQNLVYVSNIDADFLGNWHESNTAQTNWDRVIDTDLQELSEFGAKLSSSMQLSKNTHIEIQGKSYSTYHLIEKVTYNSALYGQASWSNEFWFDTETQQLLRSTQTMSPKMDSVEIIYLSRALRLNNSNTQSKISRTLEVISE